MFGEKLSVLRLDALRTAPLQRHPFPFVVIPDFLRLDYQEELSRDFPQIKSRGSFPLNRLTHGDSFARLVSELNFELRIYQDQVAPSLPPKPQRARLGLVDCGLWTADFRP